MTDRYRDRPFPADDNYARDSRSSPQPSSQEDPLAELARLIGQADPFANLGRDQRPAQHNAQPYDTHQHDTHQSGEPASGYDEEPARPSWLQNLASARQTQEQPYAQQEQHGHREQQYGQEQQYDPRYVDPLGPDPHRADPHVAEPRFDLSPRLEPQNFNAPQVPQEQDWGQHPLPDNSARYDHVLYGQPDHDPGHGTPFNVNDGYGDEYAPPPYGEERRTLLRAHVAAVP